MLLAGCGSTGTSGGGLPVVATTTQVADWAREIGGPDVDVHQILRPNTDPHEYEPRPDDVAATTDARVVFESGEGLDGWVSKLVSAAGGDPARVDLADAVPIRRAGDAHWWHDPRNVEAAAAAIAAALGRADPAHRAAYATRARRYQTRIRRLDAELRRCIAQVPPRARLLVTDHDALGYFADRYGLRVVGAVIPSLSTAAQASAGESTRLIDLIEREHVRAVFPEASVNARLAEAIARASGATARYRLYGDTLGPAGSSGTVRQR